MNDVWDTKYSHNSMLLFIISYHSHKFFYPECFILLYYNEALHTVSVQCYMYITAVIWETTDYVILHGSCVRQLWQKISRVCLGGFFSSFQLDIYKQFFKA